MELGEALYDSSDATLNSEIDYLHDDRLSIKLIA